MLHARLQIYSSKFVYITVQLVGGAKSDDAAGQDFSSEYPRNDIKPHRQEAGLELSRMSKAPSLSLFPGPL